MAGGSLHDCLFGPRKAVPLSPLQRWKIACQTAEEKPIKERGELQPMTVSKMRSCMIRDCRTCICSGWFTGTCHLKAFDACTWQRQFLRCVGHSVELCRSGARKSMNILLDSAQNAKICDFGLAHQMCMEPNTKSKAMYCMYKTAHATDKFSQFRSTHIARKLDGEGGSPRYMAPECYDAKIGKLTATCHRCNILMLGQCLRPAPTCCSDLRWTKEKVDIWAAGCILIVP